MAAIVGSSQRKNHLRIQIMHDDFLVPMYLFLCYNYIYIPLISTRLEMTAQWHNYKRLAY